MSFFVAFQVVVALRASVVVEVVEVVAGAAMGAVLLDALLTFVLFVAVQFVVLFTGASPAMSLFVAFQVVVEFGAFVVVEVVEVEVVAGAAMDAVLLDALLAFVLFVAVQFV